MVSQLHLLYFGSAPSAEAAEAMEALRDGPRIRSCQALPEAAATRPLGYYTGTYSNPAYGKAVVKKDGEALRMSLGPDRVTGPLVPLGGDTFRFDFPDWPGNSKKVLFRGEESGKAAKLSIEGFEDVRSGVFKRIGN